MPSLLSSSCVHGTIGFVFPSSCRIIPRTGTLAGAEALWLTMQVSRGCPVGEVEAGGHPFS